MRRSPLLDPGVTDVTHSALLVTSCFFLPTTKAPGSVLPLSRLANESHLDMQLNSLYF